jgi:hypothetical protein
MMDMFKIIPCTRSTDCISTFFLVKDDNLMGAITIYPSKRFKTRGILEIFIEEEHRKKWLAKNFAVQIKVIIRGVLREKNIKEVHTEATAYQSPRLLDFFGFKRYNNVYYKLNV